jgi:hypothetical protein
MASFVRSPHRVLDVPRAASLAVIEAAYDRARRLLDQGAMASYGMFDATSAEKMRAEIDEAYAILRQEAAERGPMPAHEGSIAPVHEMPTPQKAHPAAQAATSPHPPTQRVPPPALTKARGTQAPKPRTRLCPPRSEPLTEPCTGAVLRRLREEAGADVEAVCELTKINRRYVKALEEDDFPLLPASVYIRGFVGEYARILGLDAAHVTLTYMSAYRQWAQASH